MRCVGGDFKNGLTICLTPVASFFFFYFSRTSRSQALDGRMHVFHTEIVYNPKSINVARLKVGSVSNTHLRGKKVKWKIHFHMTNDLF